MWIYDLDEKSAYILGNYQNLLTPQEQKVLSCFFWQVRSEYMDSSQMKGLVRKRLISHEPEIIEIVEHGFENFAGTTIERLLNECEEEIFLNHCPKCGALARTPNAKQCPKCFYSWHDEI